MFAERSQFQTFIALSVLAHDMTLFGVPCRVSPELGTDALVIGLLRPRVFVGASLLAALADDELEAVVYHEDHHRRTRAPLRAAALGAWLRLLGRSESVRSTVLDRLTDLETLADADAIRRGSSPQSLARALLKGDLSLQPVAFSYAADRRVERLLDRAAGIPIDDQRRL
ncbi:MAG: putative family unassigned peptidase, partial [candidate division NC10 bacterium]|nr:putative family unassigned peptidase [candidate division NC10 bacterium]